MSQKLLVAFCFFGLMAQSSVSSGSEEWDLPEEKCVPYNSLYRTGGYDRQEALHNAKKGCLGSFKTQIAHCERTDGWARYSEPFHCSFHSTDQNGNYPWMATYQQMNKVYCCRKQ
jgi:hypothetical protein